MSQNVVNKELLEVTCSPTDVSSIKADLDKAGRMLLFRAVNIETKTLVSREEERGGEES